MQAGDFVRGWTMPKRGLGCGIAEMGNVMDRRACVEFDVADTHL